MCRTSGLAVFAVALLGGQPSRADVPSFLGLGVGTYVADLSGDGRVAVGSGSSSAFRWEAGTLGHLPGYPSSAAELVSQNGSVIVGHVGSQQVRWVNGVMTAMSGLGGYSSVTWSGLSADGSVVVGNGLTGSIRNPIDAVRWTNDSVQILEGTSINDLWVATDTTADGGSIVGVNPDGGFRWDNGTVSHVCIDPGDSNTIMYGISNDGSVMVGCHRELIVIPPWGGAAASDSEGSASDSSFYRWVNGVPEAIGEPPVGTPSALYATYVELSGDGSTICHSQALYPAELDPNQLSSADLKVAIWRAETGWRNIEDILIDDCHFDLTGWTIGAIKGISDDGLTIVGLGKNPAGQVESWIAHIPEPTSAALSLVAFGLLGRGRIGRIGRIRR